jgi:abelson tyrosine-protein kinase 1
MEPVPEGRHPGVSLTVSQPKATLPNRSPDSVGRQYTYQLRSGHKAAHLVTETTNYQYMTSLDAPKKWFNATVDSILGAYGEQYRLEKEDLFLGKI